MTYHHFQSFAAPVVARPRREALGAVICSGVDEDKWKSENTVPIFEDKVNNWLIKLTGEAYSVAEAIQQVRSQFEGVYYTWFGGDAGRCTDLQYTYWADRNVFEQEMGLGEPIRDSDWTFNPQIKWAESEHPAVWVHVKFVYRGNLKEFPWPVYQTPPASDCPFDTRCAVDRVYAPDFGWAEPEDPCDVPGSTWHNPDCTPFLLDPKKWFDLTEWPAWAWWAAAGGVLYFAWPVVIPLVGGAFKAGVGATASLASSVAGGDEKSKPSDKSEDAKEATPNRRKRSRRRTR